MSAPQKMTALTQGVEDDIEWCTAAAPFPPAVNGYARLPEGHAWRDLDLQMGDEGPDVHGGITFGPELDGWIGFDFLHVGDYWPGGPFPRFDRDVVRTAAEVEAEAKSLARQIAAAR